MESGLRLGAVEPEGRPAALRRRRPPHGGSIALHGDRKIGRIRIGSSSASSASLRRRPDAARPAAVRWVKRGEILALGSMSCMDFQRAPTDPADAARAFAGRLAEAGLPCFASAAHDVELDLLKVTWTHGVMLYMDLTRQGFDEPIDEYGRAVILGLRPCCGECATRDETDRGSDSSRTEIPIPGYGPVVGCRCFADGAGAG
jgi:hypothetical protein